MPDLVTRFRVADLLDELQASNMEVWKDWSMSAEAETRRVDPDVQERLRALGYID